MISSPAPDSFVHVAHVGFNENGIVETSKDLDPAWAKLLGDLQAHGVRQSIVEENLDFVEGFLAGAKSKTKAADITKVVPRREGSELYLLLNYRLTII